MNGYVPEGLAVQRPDSVPQPYREQLIPPSESLKDLVQQFWHFEWMLPDQTEVKSWVLPSGLANIVFQHVAERGLEGRLIGPRTEAYQRVLEGSGFLIGALLQPASLFAVTGREAKSFVNAHSTLEEVFGPSGRSVTQSVSSTIGNFPVQAEYLSTFLEDRWTARKNGEYKLANEVFSEIAAAQDLMFVGTLPAKFNCSERTIQRLFDRHVGISPKFLVRTRRFQGAVKALMNGTVPDWAELALSLGYYDQSHFVNDFREMTGRSPSEVGRIC